MTIWQPFQRESSTIHASLGADEMRRLFAADEFNRHADDRSPLVTALGDGFTAHLEPDALYGARSRAHLSHFPIEVIGQPVPAQYGTFAMTIGFSRSASIGQIAWQLIVLLLAGLWGVLYAPLITLGTILMVCGGPFILLCALVSYAQGLVRSERDWRTLRGVVRQALGDPRV